MTTQATGVWLDGREERQVTTQATAVWLDGREGHFHLTDLILVHAYVGCLNG